MSVHIFVRFEPQPGKEKQFREELVRVVEPTRAEAGCLSIGAFQSLREPPVFTIHSEWVDEAAFDRHGEFAHTVHFIRAAEALMTHPIKALRTHSIAGGAGAGSAG